MSLIFDYENLFPQLKKSSKTSADQLIQYGWKLSKYPVVDLSKNIPWGLDSVQNRSLNFHLHSLDPIDHILKSHTIFNELSYLSFALNVVFDWINHNSELTKPNISPFAWYDMAVGLRSYRIAYLYQAADVSGLLDDDARNMLWSCLEQHASYLADDANIAFHNNHGYYQVAGQLAMGRRFADISPVMAAAQEQGAERLKLMLSQQFSTDGVHREHSPDYHRMVLDTLRALIDLGLVVDSETIDLSNRIEEALSWFVFPNQRIVNFGDSDYRLLARKPKEAEAKWTTPQMQFWVSCGKVGEPPSESFRAFNEGGYWVARKSDDNPNELSSYCYLALNAAFHSRTHKHADDLSFVWFDCGSNILVDAGRYGYIGKAEQGSDLWLDGHWYSDPRRVYCESTRAHNTLEFDGKNFPRKGIKPYGSGLRRTGEHSSGVLYAEAESKYFGSIRHVRMLFFMPGQWLVVFDWFHDNNDQPHEVKQWFHLHHELQLLMDQNQYIVSLPSSDKLLRIGSLLAEPAASRPYIGEEEPVMQGWWSAKERDIVPNYAFCQTHSNVSSGAFATLFSFTDSLEPNHAWSKVNASGRKGQFSWRDGAGQHQLKFERPSDGECMINYKIN